MPGMAAMTEPLLLTLRREPEEMVVMAKVDDVALVVVPMPTVSAEMVDDESA